jgi:hypothetical protein
MQIKLIRRRCDQIRRFERVNSVLREQSPSRKPLIRFLDQILFFALWLHKHLWPSWDVFYNYTRALIKDSSMPVDPRGVVYNLHDVWGVICGRIFSRCISVTFTAVANSLSFWGPVRLPAVLMRCVHAKEGGAPTLQGWHGSRPAIHSLPFIPMLKCISFSREKHSPKDETSSQTYAMRFLLKAPSYVCQWNDLCDYVIALS